ncbi:hypothetical protein PCANC_10013 [Puccinia coronata f. sp. avenae]|uniref:Uncharacterized protein n=1 Tax=Puccinia coronata f. sp. avenae TaxID=200324 RepID=A0A2N5T039_9BASI|nr:hypothetical protein PCASD_16815 [Puccinia coronata f. sp. avenae]PLW40339.1 hypothetical protein PCASD_07291 [Puccinia coronata f. sp. avenae]PLW43011.1 hypothetical protein PCANC_10013 [Puccinia coronata f. sp. avenae]
MNKAQSTSTTAFRARNPNRANPNTSGAGNKQTVASKPYPALNPNRLPRPIDPALNGVHGPSEQIDPGLNVLRDHMDVNSTKKGGGCDPQDGGGEPDQQSKSTSVQLMQRRLEESPGIYATPNANCREFLLNKYYPKSAGWPQ